MLLALVFAVQVFAQAGSPIVAPPIESHTTTTVNLVAPPPDPTAIADASVQSTNAVLLQVIAPIPVDWDNQLFSVGDVWRHTPDDLTWNNGQIRGLTDLTRNVALGLLALAVIARAFAHMLGQGAGYGRLVYGTVLAIGDLVWWEWGIKLNNAVNDAIGAPDLPSLIRPHIGLNVNPGQQTANVMLVIVYAVVALLVLISLLFRLGLIQVLIAIGPLALFCATTEQSAHLANKYIGLSVGLLFSQVMVVLGMKVAQVDAAVGTGIAGTFMALVVLLLIRRLPGLVSSATGSAGSGITRVVQNVVVRRFTGAFR
ncbi:MAG: hypothetical protein NVS4B6_19170 [Mycobacterium sp.]